MKDEEKNLLYYFHPNGDVRLGEAISPPQGKENDWKMCAIKIAKNHVGIFTGKQMLNAEMASKKF